MDDDLKLGSKLGMILAVLLLLAVAFVSGFLLSSSRYPQAAEEAPEVVKCPEWEVGQFWLYAYETPDIVPTMARTVVADRNDTQYQLGIDNRLDAQRHAVLNYNPMLGRITRDNLAVFEKGAPVDIFQFPLRTGDRWNFSFLGRESWDAQVKSVKEVSVPAGGHSIYATIEAKSSGGDVLRYTFDSRAEWLLSLVLTTSKGQEEVRMTLTSHGTGYKGEAYFVRGVDLYQKEMSSSSGSPAIDFYDSFLDRGHPAWGPFDSLIYYIEVEAGSQSNGLLTLRDHSTTTVLRRTIDPGTAENGLGSIPSSGGEVGVTIALQGNIRLLLMVAGGMEYKWTV